MGSGARAREELPQHLPASGRLRPSRPKQAAAVFACLVAALGVYGSYFYLSLPRRLPSPIDWRSAAVLLARDSRRGDAVALVPWWAERAREVLPASLPVLAYPHLAGEELLGVRRIWFLSLPDTPGFQSSIELEIAGRALRSFGPHRLGGLELTRYDLRAPVLPLAFLPDRLATATVSLHGSPCVPDARSTYRCVAAQSISVRREEREVDLLPRPCLYAHPPADLAGPLVISFPNVPLGRVLRGHTGIVGELALGGTAPIHLSVSANGRALGAADEPPASPGWHAFQFDTGAEAGKVETVTFSLTAGEADERHLCFDAYTLP